jgi:small redox-active disulfide protein 2
MMEIKVLGTGCASCKALYLAVEQVVKELGLTAEITKEEDLMKIMEYNVMTLPALVVDGKVVAKGKISAKEIKTVLTK